MYYIKIIYGIIMKFNKENGFNSKFIYIIINWIK